MVQELNHSLQKLNPQYICVWCSTCRSLDRSSGWGSEEEWKFPSASVNVAVAIWRWMNLVRCHSDCASVSQSDLVLNLSLGLWPGFVYCQDYCVVIGLWFFGLWSNSYRWNLFWVIPLCYNIHVNSLKNTTQFNKWHCTLLHVLIPKDSSSSISYKTFKTYQLFMSFLTL